MTRRYLAVGLVWVVGGCTSSTASPSGGAETADSAVEASTLTATGDGAANPANRSEVTPPQSTESTTANAADSTSESEPLTGDTVTAASNDAGATGVVSCDPRKVVCKLNEPTCEYGYVRRIIDGCYGECVRIDDCVCSGADACPQRERYTCNNSRQRCTPYLN